MFDFENLEVYRKAKELNTEILQLLKENKQIDLFICNQLQRSSVSVVINIAEGSGRFSKADKKNFYTISRGSVYESVSLLDIILDTQKISSEQYIYFKQKFEVVSKMFFGLIKSQSTK